MHTTNLADSEAHEALASLLPYYAQDSLAAAERVRVETHLAQCNHCREALGGWRTLAGGVKEAAAAQAPVWSPTPAHFAQLAARLAPNASATLEHAAAPARASRQPAAARGGWWEQLRAWFGIAPAGMRLAFALPSLAVFVLAGLLWQQSLTPRNYETLARAPVAVGAVGELRVVFQASISEGELREALRQIDARIVDGPSALAVYTLKLGAQAKPQQALESLRANAKVRFAELNSTQQ